MVKLLEVIFLNSNSLKIRKRIHSKELLSKVYIFEASVNWFEGFIPLIHERRYQRFYSGMKENEGKTVNFHGNRGNNRPRDFVIFNIR